MYCHLDEMSLQSWLAVDPEPPDVYIIGFQELDLRHIFLFIESFFWLSSVHKFINVRSFILPLIY